MSFLTIFLMVLLLSGFGEAASIYPNTATVDDARQKIADVIDGNVKNINERPFIAGLVRLAFHDCVGDGGCDGCIDHQNPSNKGLLKYTKKLDAAFDYLTSGTMSRADFYVLAGYVALEKATEGKGGSEVFNEVPKFGREDCPTSPHEADGANEVFPDAKWNLPEIEDFFASEFASEKSGFTRTDVAAILGAHSLGRASVSNSGYEGKWIQNTHRQLGRAHSDVLDNSYYSQILRDADNENLSNHWRQINVVSGTNKQWQRRNNINQAATFDAENFPVNNKENQRNMFLNVDMCLRWDLNVVDSTTGEALQAGDSAALGDIQGFAARQGGNEAFITAFGSAFEKMVENKEDETLI
ncbi:putative ascorbate peroxidase [Clytia hemisphaerica]